MFRFALPVAVALLCACAQEIPSADLVIQGVNVIDVRDGSVAENMTMVIDSGRIRAVASEDRLRVPAGTPAVDGSGRYAIPGLWDMHVHAIWPSWYEPFMKLFVAHGVTGFRDTWGELELARQLRAERASGERAVPRFLVAGNLIDGKGAVWEGSVTATSPEEGRHVVDSLVAAGAEFIKVYSLLGSETFHAIAEQSKSAGKHFGGHVPGTVRAGDAAAAGMWTIEHLTGVPEGCSSAEEEIIAEFVVWRSAVAAGDTSVPYLQQDDRRVLSTQDPERCDSLMQTFVEHGTWHVPTLVTMRGYAHLNDPEFQNDPRLRYLAPDVSDFWMPEHNEFVRERTEEEWRTGRESLALLYELAGRAHQAGVPILAGSDTPNPYAFPGSGLHDELELLVDAGLTPLEALQAATLSPARILETTDSLGTLEVDRLADIVLLEGNPVEDIQQVRNIYAVLMGGELFDRERLDALLGEVEAHAEAARAATSGS